MSLMTRSRRKRQVDISVNPLCVHGQRAAGERELQRPVRRRCAASPPEEKKAGAAIVGFRAAFSVCSSQKCILSS